MDFNWPLNFSTSNLDHQKYIRQTKKVESHPSKILTWNRQSDVPYGVLLSGGLDSSLVASIMSRNSQRFPRFEFWDGMGVVPKMDRKTLVLKLWKFWRCQIKSCWVLIHQCCIRIEIIAFDVSMYWKWFKLATDLSSWMVKTDCLMEVYYQEIGEGQLSCNVSKNWLKLTPQPPWF